MQMKRTTHSLLFGLIMAGLAAVALAIFSHYNAIFPYYTAWDMDLTTVIDSLLIGSHQLPGHFDHTTFGMLIILSWLKDIAIFFHCLPVGNLNQLAHSLNPLLVIAQLTAFMRQVSPFIAVLSAINIFFALYYLLRPHKLFAVIVFILILSASGFIIEAAVIRSELYAIFFWSLALALSSIIMHQHGRRTQIIGILFIGLLLGMSFTTKVQAIFYIMAVPIFILWCNNFFKQHIWQNMQAITPPYGLLLAIFNFILFTELSIAAQRIGTTTINKLVLTSCDHFSLTPRWYLVFITLLISLLLSCYCLWLQKKRANLAKLYPPLTFCSLLLCGFLFSFLMTPLLHGMHIKLDFLHSIFMFKILFMGHVLPSITRNMGIHSWADIHVLWQLLPQVKTVYLCLIASYIMLAYHTYRQHYFLNRQQFIYITLLLLLCIAMMIFGVRHGDALRREVIWLLCLPLFVLLLNCFIVLRSPLSLVWFNRVITGLIVILILQAFAQAQIYPAVATFWRDKFLFSPMARTQLQYNAIMHGYYGRMSIVERRFALLNSTQYRDYQHLLQRLQIAKYTDLSQVSVLHTGFRLQAPSQQQETIQHFNRQLRNSMLLKLDLKLLDDKSLGRFLTDMLWQFDHPAYIAIDRQQDKHWFIRYGHNFIASTTPQHHWRHYRVYALSLRNMQRLYHYRHALARQRYFFVFAKHRL